MLNWFRRQTAFDRRLSFAFGALGALVSAAAWAMAGDPAARRALSAAFAPQALAPILAGAVAVLAIGALVGAVLVRRLNTRHARVAGRLEALADGDLESAIPMIDQSGVSGRLARAAFALQVRARGAARSEALQRAHAEQEHQLNLRLIAAAESERRQLIEALASGLSNVLDQRRSDGRMQPAPSSIAPVAARREVAVPGVPLAAANEPEFIPEGFGADQDDGALHGVLDRLGRLQRQAGPRSADPPSWIRPASITAA